MKTRSRRRYGKIFYKSYIREVIEQAVETEKLGYEFYTIMSKKFEKNENLKKLFNTLAVKEQRHEKAFSELKEIISDETPEN